MQSGLTLSVPARPEMLRHCRRILAGFAQALGADPLATAAVTFASNEAIANVVQHAYGERGGVVRIGAVKNGGRLVVLVTDEGNWGDAADPAEHGGGRGLKLMEAFAESVTIKREGGTQVELVFALARDPLRAAGSRVPRSLARSSIPAGEIGSGNGPA